ncbi:MAG TPA: biotin--[acetyl-CoA-carboxylase] ligase [Ignavibacteria bacterium]|nr:biotin--[acetyl-CoA-carboxylase] ligase [Ignavibacteria bacterium]HMR41395.1 biotin--[acetyl-CoA-carboxylase] ligase [Ignavibacteria bacterium]
MNIELLKKELIKDNCLSEIMFFDEIGSTNEYARKHDLPDNTLLITDKQTKGSGRFSRNWESAPGKDLTFTLVKKINIGIDDIFLINFYTSYIIFNSIKKICAGRSADNLFLKWPNDILFNGKKISGILTDVRDLRSETKNFIIGAGINVNCSEFSDGIKSKATSILKESGSEMDKTLLLKNIILNFYKNLDLINDGKKLMSLWKSNTDIIGKEISFRQFNDGEGISYKVENIDTDGGLVVIDDKNNRKKFNSGEISIGYDNL